MPSLRRMPALVYVKSKQGRGGKLELRETINLAPVIRAQQTIKARLPKSQQ